MQLWQAAQKFGFENLLNFFVSKSACSMHAKISKEFDVSWSRVLKCARIQPTLRLKRVQSGICWSLPQMCKNSPHFETQKCTIWHLLKPTSKLQEFTPLWDSKVYNLAFVEACLKCRQKQKLTLSSTNQVKTRDWSCLLPLYSVSMISFHNKGSNSL